MKGEIFIYKHFDLAVIDIRRIGLYHDFSFSAGAMESYGTLKSLRWGSFGFAGIGVERSLIQMMLDTHRLINIVMLFCRISLQHEMPANLEFFEVSMASTIHCVGEQISCVWSRRSIGPSRRKAVRSGSPPAKVY